MKRPFDNNKTNKQTQTREKNKKENNFDMEQIEKKKVKYTQEVSLICSNEKKMNGNREKRKKRRSVSFE